jgi:hypothetical protein
MTRIATVASWLSIALVMYWINTADAAPCDPDEVVSAVVAAKDAPRRKLSRDELRAQLSARAMARQAARAAGLESAEEELRDDMLALIRQLRDDGDEPPRGAVRVGGVRPPDRATAPSARRTGSRRPPAAAGAPGRPVAGAQRRRSAPSASTHELRIEKIAALIAKTTDAPVIQINPMLLATRSITVAAPGPLETNDELLDRVYASLTYHGLAVVTRPDGETLIGSIHELAASGDLRIVGAGTRIAADAKPAELIIKVFAVEHVSPVIATDMIGEMLPAHASLTFHPSLRRIIVRADVGTCRNVQTLIDELDRS